MEVTARKTADTVVDWRRRQLVQAGFGEALADRLSCDPRYDLHALIELAERGCPPALAVQILAPFDERAA
jgi:hypothetical protein